jgi:phosphate transport system substrate-binding protein
LWLLFLLLSACAKSPTPTPVAVQFSLVADESTLPLVETLVDAYVAERSYVTINLQKASIAPKGLEMLTAGEVDLALLCWLPDDSEAAATQTLWSLPFARDGITLITHSSNPVAGMSLLQLREAYTGRVIDWRALGGLALDLTIVSREEGSGTRTLFERRVLDGREVTLTSVVMPNGEAVVEYVTITPGALGYVSLGQVAPAVNVLSVEGVAPSAATVADGSYPLSRSFYLVAQSEPTEGLREFVDWVLSSAGQKIVGRTYGRAP